MAGRITDKDKAKLARRWAGIYKAATDLQVLASELEGQPVTVELRLDDTSFSGQAGGLKFGARQSGL